MLTKKEKEKIIKLIKLGYTDYKIGMMTHHSPNTIKPIREELLQKGEYPVSKSEVNFDSAIDYFRNEVSRIREGINKFQLKGQEKKEKEKLAEDISKILKTEVDDRIDIEVEKAVKKNDQEWNRRIEQQYVKKEVVVNLENKLTEKNEKTELLSNEIKKKDDINNKQQSEYLQNLSFKQNEIDSLKNQNRDRINENLNIMKENICQYNYINNRLDNDVRFGQQELNCNIQIFNSQQNDFEKYKNKYLNFFNDLLLNMNEVQEGLKIREENVDHSKRKINIFLEQLNKESETLKKTREEQRAEGLRLQKWHEQLVDITDYLNNFSLIDLNSGKPLFFNILNIKTNQKNNKMVSEGYTHHEYNDNEKEKSIKNILPSNIEQIKPSITPLNPKDFPPLDKVFNLFGKPIKHQGFFTNLNY